jgi:hypothetical protein
MSFLIRCLGSLLVIGGTAVSFGATYYVSSSAGDDSHTGSAESPWSTLAKVATARLSPGDQVLLRRGDTWRETLNLNSSGAQSAPIAVGAYGEGANPRILGSESRSGLQAWIQAEPGIWFTQTAWNPKSLFHDGSGGANRPARTALVSDWDWLYDPQARGIYVRLDVNPGQFAVEVSRRPGIGWAGTSHITISDLEIAYADFGIAMYGAADWTIQRVFIHDIAVDAIHGNGGAKHGTIQDCVLENWNWHGFGTAPGSSEAFMGYGIHILNTTSSGNDGWIVQRNRLTLDKVRSGVDSTAIAVDAGGFASLISGNRITGNAATEMGGIMFWRPQGSGAVQISGNRIESVGAMGINVSEFSAFSFNGTVTIERNIVLNAGGRDSLDQEALRVWTSNTALVSVRGNLVAGTPAGKYEHPGIRVRQSRAIVSDNTIWGTDVGISIERGSTDVIAVNNISSGNRKAAVAVDSNSWCTEYNNDWDGATPGWRADASSFSADPGFLDSVNGDFHLASNSPAIGRGALSLPSLPDLDGNIRPVAGHWDIGAYAFADPERVSIVSPRAIIAAGSTVQFSGTVTGASGRFVLDPITLPRSASTKAQSF